VKNREKDIRKWQIRLNGLSKVIACGWELTHDIEKHIQDSRFVIDELVNVSPFLEWISYIPTFEVLPLNPIR